MITGNRQGNDRCRGPRRRYCWENSGQSILIFNLTSYRSNHFPTAKQLQDGAKNVPVGKVIALLAEEGDDISNLQPPKEDKPAPRQAAPSPSSPLPDLPKPSPTMNFTSSPSQLPPSTPLFHSRPLFPSVHRLLLEFGVTEPQSIKGTGVRGMLTKGDVLAYLGKASGPLGTYKETSVPHAGGAKAEKKEEYKVSG
jgi:pyruvate/2-oxoglutarate dehydrogenase complex dihydrolipoamide acyltransferase (E2) component